METTTKWDRHQAVFPANAENGREPAGREEFKELYRQVRQQSEALCQTLAPEDYVVQTMPEISPTKWHLAHTTWFFETFVLQRFLPGHRPVHPQYAFLFNSYYNALGKMHARPQRGLLSRPTVRETFAYRRQVDAIMQELLDNVSGEKQQEIAPVILLGINHEQQHQELMLTDIKNVFSLNPLRPVFREEKPRAEMDVPELSWQAFKAGLYQIGHGEAGFCFGNETPRHRVWLESFAIASRLVTNREYLAFINEGGYQRPELWLSLGWNTVQERGWTAPLYWEKRGGNWWMMTLGGMREARWDEPVCHISYFEADAYARWAGVRLPSEQEWEAAAGEAPLTGRFLEASYFHPSPLLDHSRTGDLSQLFGETWQWTRSSYAPYPGYEPAQGALGEYNGKFMCNQYVLRGASCATPRAHARRSYRNFFPPDARWQFSGIRLARNNR